MRVRAKRLPSGKIEREVIIDFPPAPTGIIVAGAPRSGTSVTCSVLDKLGVWFPQRLKTCPVIDPFSGSVYGYFEDPVMCELAMDAVYHYTKIDLHHPEKHFIKDMHYLCFDAPEYRGWFLQRFYNTILEYEEHPLWGMKLFRGLHNYEQFLDFTRSNLKVVYITRNFDDNLKSLERIWEGGEQHEQALCALREYAEMIALLSHNVVHITYEDLVRNPEQVVGRIAQFVGVPVKKEAIEVIARK